MRAAVPDEVADEPSDVDGFDAAFDEWEAGLSAPAASDAAPSDELVIEGDDGDHFVIEADHRDAGAVEADAVEPLVVEADDGEPLVIEADNRDELLFEGDDGDHFEFEADDRDRFVQPAASPVEPAAEEGAEEPEVSLQLDAVEEPDAPEASLELDAVEDAEEPEASLELVVMAPEAQEASLELEVVEAPEASLELEVVEAPEASLELEVVEAPEASPELDAVGADDAAEMPEPVEAVPPIWGPRETAEPAGRVDVVTPSAWQPMETAEPVEDVEPAWGFAETAEPIEDVEPAALEPIPAAEPADLADLDGEPAALDAEPEPAEPIALDEVEELDLDEVEELDDVEMLAVEGEADADQPVAPPPLPPRPPVPAIPVSVPGSIPGPPGPGVRTATVPPVIPQPDSLPQPGAVPLPDDDDAALESSHEPPNLEIETPTVLDEAIADLGERSWENRALALAGELDATDDRTEIGALAYELGELQERFLADEAEAVKAYGKALQADPSLRPNLWAIRRVFYRRGLWPNLLKLLSAEVRFARDDRERADLHVERGHVLEDRLDNLSEARTSYEEALASDPGHPGALAGLERIALADGDDEALLHVLEARAEHATSPERALPFLLDLARALIEQGGESLAQAGEVLARAAALGVDTGRVARVQLRVAEIAGDPEGVVAALDALIADRAETAGPAGLPEPSSGAPRAPGEPLGREDALRLEVVAMRRRQARVARDELDDAERAWGYLQQALALAPGEPLLLGDLADAAEKLGKFDELSGLIQGWEAVEGDPERAMGLQIRRADALLRSGRRDEARALLADLAAAAPGYLATTALRERDALTGGEWDALAEAYLAAAEAARLGTSFGTGDESRSAPDPDGAAACYTAAGDLLAAFVGDDERARTVFGQALEVRPGYPPALDALVSLCEATGRLDDAAEMLERHADVLPADERAPVLERLGRLYQDLGDPERRLSATQRLLALSPDDTRLRWRVEAALADAGRPAERAALLVEIAEATDDPSRRGGALLTAARLYDEQLGDAGRAAALYRQVLEVWPGDQYARAALISMLRRSGNHEELVAARRTEAAELPDGAMLARALREAARLLEAELGESAAAEEAYRALLDRMPGHAGALRELAENLVRREDWDALLDVLAEEVDAREADAQADEAARMGLRTALLRLAQLQEQVGRPDDAADTYHRAVEAGPGAVAAAVARVELSAERGPAARVDALGDLAAALSAPELMAELWEEIGWLWTFALREPERGLDAFATALEHAPGSLSAMLGAALLHAQRGELAEVARSLDAMTSEISSRMATETVVAAGADASGGVPTTVPEGDNTRAVAAAMLLRASAIAEVEGDHEQALRRLARAASFTTDAGDAVLVLADRRPRRAGPVDSAESLLAEAERLTARSQLAAGASTRIEWELDRADALERAGHLRAAADIAAAVLAEIPGDLRALAIIRTVCARAGDRAGQARASLALANVLTDRDAVRALLGEAASILDAELGDVDHAMAVYRRLLTIDPGADEFERACELCRQGSDIRTLVELMSNRLSWLDEVAGDPSAPVATTPESAQARDAMIPLLLERAQLREAVGDRRGASSDLAALLALDGGHAKALGLRAKILVKLGDSGQAASLYQRFLEVETDPVQRAEAELTLSRILAEDMDDIQGAIEQLERVVALSPDDVDVRERLVGLLTRAKAWPRIVEHIRAIENRRATPGAQAQDELRVAQIYRDQIADVRGARDALDRARKLDPLNIDAVRELQELLAGDPAERARVLETAAGDVRDAIRATPAQSALYGRLASIHEWRGDGESRYFALCALGALTTLAADQRQFVTRQRSSVATGSAPSDAIGKADWERHLSALDAHYRGTATELWGAFATAVAASIGSEPGRLGYGRGDRISGKSLARQYPFTAAVATAFGADDVDLYVSEARPGFSRAVMAGRPAVLLGADVARCDSPIARFAVARAFAHVREGTCNLPDLREDETLLYLAAAARLAGADLSGELAGVAAADPGGLDERVGALQKNLSWREKRALSPLAPKFGELGDARAWRRDALAGGVRAGLLVCGDLTSALDAMDIGTAGRALIDDPAALDLLAWAVSPGHAALRRVLGLSGDEGARR